MKQYKTNTPSCDCLPLFEWVSLAIHDGEPVFIMQNDELSSKEKNKLHAKAYQQSVEYKEYAKNYRNKPESILARKAYRLTEKAKAAEKARRNLDSVKNYIRLNNRKPETIKAKKEYAQSAEGKEYFKNYHKRPEVVAKRQSQERKDCLKKWQQSEKGRLMRKVWLESYKKTKKYRASVSAQASRRRAIKKRAPLADAKVIAAWFKKWKTLDVVFCHWCHGQFKVKECEADHVMPISKGGAHSIDNLVISCVSCNRRKAAKTPSEWVAELRLQPI